MGQQLVLPLYVHILEAAAAANTGQTNIAMTNSHPTVNSKLLCNVEKLTKNCLLRSTNLLPHHYCVYIWCKFVAGPNERIFAAIMFVAAACVPRLSYARSSGPSLKSIFGKRSFGDTHWTFWPWTSLTNYQGVLKQGRTYSNSLKLFVWYKEGFLFSSFL